MNIRTSPEAQIEAYLLDAMSAEERARFSEELKFNKDLQEQLELQRAAYAAAEVRAEDAFLRKVGSWNLDALIWRLFPFITSVGLLLLTVAGVLVILHFIPSKNLYGDYFETYPAPTVERIPSQGEVASAIESYKSGNFEQSARLFEESNNVADPVWEFYAGLSYLSITPPKPAKAIPHLKSAGSSDSEIKEQAEWYLALAFLKNGDEAQAESMLRLISAAKHEKQAEATELLRELN